MIPITSPRFTRVAAIGVGEAVIDGVGVNVGVDVGVMVGVGVGVIVGVGVFVGLKSHLFGIHVGKTIVGIRGLEGLGKIGSLKNENADASCGLTVRRRIIPNNIKIIFFIFFVYFTLVLQNTQ